MVRVTEGSLEMKTLLVSFVVGLLVGVAYGVIRVKSPAPPIVALLGLLGMVLGEQGGGRLRAKRVQSGNVSSAPIVAERKIQSVVSSINEYEIRLEGGVQ
jgi:XapX domain-containing protein